MKEEKHIDTELINVEELARDADVPAGYVKVAMSTKGFGYAPKTFHIKDLSVEETLQLGMTAPEEIPVKFPAMMDKLIYEKDVHVGDFMDGEVSEFMIWFYVNFYQHKLKDIDYKLDEKTKQWALKNMFGGVDGQPYQNWLRGIERGDIPLHFDIDLYKIRFYSITEKIKTTVEYERKGFKAVFAYPRFGDAAILQKAVKDKFREQDAQIGPLYDIYKRKMDMEKAIRRGERIDQSQIPYLDEEDLNAARQYEIEKTVYTISLMKGMYLKSIDGRDVSNLSLAERVEIAKDPRIDYPCYQTIQEAFKDMKVGPVPLVEITNPVTGEVEKDYEYPFRALELLAFIKNYRPDDATVEYV